jgi:hypothetical protein
VLDSFPSQFRPVDSTLRPWQLRPIKAKLFTSLTHHSSVEDLVRASKRHLRLAAFSMDCDDDLTFASLFMFVSVKRQPRSVNHFRNVALSLALLPLSLTRLRLRPTRHV